MNINLSKKISHLLDTLIENQIRPVLVGGYLRDHFLDLDHSKDIDIELYGVSSVKQLTTLLKTFADPYEVGKSFGVIKLKYDGYDIDFSLPRTENKISDGHRGFEVKTYQNISFKEAAIRRDFTINAMGYDFKEGILLDPFNGLKDLKNRVLSCVNKKTFIEDPLRLFRAVGFSARFNLTCKKELILLCEQMYKNSSLDTLAKERIFDELKKLLLLSKKPSIGFKLLQEMKSLKFFPALYKKSKNREEYLYTLEKLDKLADIKLDDKTVKLELMFSILVLKFKNLNEVYSFITSISQNRKFIENIGSFYSAYYKFLEMKISDYEIKKFALHVKIEDFYILAYIYSSDSIRQKAQRLLRDARALHVSDKAPSPILQGRHLIELGLKPSKKFSKLLNDAFEAQLYGKFNNIDEAKKWLQSKVLNCQSQ